MSRLQASYILPLRWEDGSSRHELGVYIRRLSRLCEEVIVVDGSPAAVFAANGDAWPGDVLHVAPDRALACPMGKVAGVMTGVRMARHERVVIADDDVRYDAHALGRVLALLDEHDLVRPQNYFAPLPWHARLDTARTLLNRALGADFPGTLGVRRSTLLAAGGYAGDVMFENLELMRTIEVAHGSSVSPLDLYVRRLPPSTGQFFRQRVRQAYDDFAIPARMCCWLAVLPALAAGSRRRRREPLLLAGAAIVAIAERGRRRAGGAAVFPAGSSLLAPAWVLERGVSAWLAVLERLRFGGVRYRGGVIPLAARSKRALRARAAAASDPVAGSDLAAGSARLASSSRLALGWSSPPGSDESQPPRAWAPSQTDIAARSDRARSPR